MHPAASGAFPGEKPAAPPSPLASMAKGSLLPADPADAPSVLDSARTDWGWGLTPRHPPGDAERLNAQSIDPADQDRLCHRTIEERWIPWSETPSTGW
jgi:hypothetical protein